MVIKAAIEFLSKFRPFPQIIALGVAIFLCEGLIMLLLDIYHPTLSPLWHGILDSFALTLLIVPFLYVLFYRPVMRTLKARDRAEDEAREKNKFLSDVFNGIQDGLCVIDRDMTILRSNPTMDIWYKHRSPIVGKKCYRVFYGRDKACDSCPSIRAMETGQRDAELIPYVGPDADAGWLEMYAYPMFDIKTLEPAGVIAYIRDVTGSKRAGELAAESEEKYQMLFENANDSIFIVDLRTKRFIDVNENAAKRLGYSKAELLELNIDEITVPSALANSEENLSKLIKQGSIVFEHIHRRKDGTEMTVEISSRIVEYAGIEVIQSVVRDITERKRMEEKLAYSERYLRSIIDNEPECVKLLDENGILLDMNPAGLKMVEADDASQVIGQNILSLVVPEHRDAFRELTRRASKGAPGSLTFEMVGLKGSRRWLESHVVPFRDEENGRDLVLGVTRDISQRMRQENMMRDLAGEISKNTGGEYFKSIVQFISKQLDMEYVLIGEFTEDNASVMTTALFADGKIRENFKYDLKGTPYENGVEEQLCIYSNNVQELFPKAKLIARMKVNSYAGLPLYSSDGSPIGLVAALGSREIKEEDKEKIDTLLRIVAGRAASEIERARAGKALKESEERLRTISDATFEGIGITEKGKVLDVNKQMARMLGYKKSELIGMDVMDLVAPESRELVARKIKEGFKGVYEHKARKKDGSIIDVEIHGEPSTYDGKVVRITTIRDVTERNMLQNEALRSAQLASLGELAAGVAHEINNPINGIINYAQMLLVAPRGVDMAEIPQRIMREGDRIAKIVRSLLTFSRKEGQEKLDVYVQEVLTEVLSLTESQLAKSGITLKLDLPENLPVVRANPQQLGQVFLNLITNAHHALNEKYPNSDENKILEIKGAKGELGGRTSLRMEFTDSGLGVSEDLISEITKPFYTSKARGAGTGLGLGICQSIIKEHGGTLSFRSEEGKYMKVTIDIPTGGPIEG